MSENLKIRPYYPSKTAQKFRDCNARWRLLRGVIGCGKSSVCALELLRRALMMPEATDGVRYSRALIVRGTYAELMNTTLKDIQAWYPSEVFGYPHGKSPIEWKIRLDNIVIVDEQGNEVTTTVDLELLMVSMDKPDDIRKVASLGLTFAWVNEGREIYHRDIYSSINNRLGRYPDLDKFRTYAGEHIPADHFWRGMWIDTNSFDDHHCLYDIFYSNSKPGVVEAFDYPAALLRSENNENHYHANPDAENIENHIGGYQYYYDAVIGASRQFVDVFILNKFGTLMDGRPIYPEFNHAIHVSRETKMMPGLPLICGYDFGLTPACLVCQITDNGQLRVLYEIQGYDSGIKNFVEGKLMHFFRNVIPQDAEFVTGVADPAGKARQQVDSSLTCIGVLNKFYQETGIGAFKVEAAVTNDFDPRKNAVVDRLTRLIDGEPAIIIDSRCDMLIRGFNGLYRYKQSISKVGIMYNNEPEDNDSTHLQDCLQYICSRYYRSVPKADMKIMDRMAAQRNGALINPWAR